MAFFYYETDTGKHILASNIKAVSEFSGIPYHKVYNWFRNGDPVHTGDTFICVQADIVKGRQRVTQAVKTVTEISQKVEKPEEVPKRDMNKYEDFFKQVDEQG